jgi:hypothetical protein
MYQGKPDIALSDLPNPAPGEAATPVDSTNWVQNFIEDVHRGNRAINLPTTAMQSVNKRIPTLSERVYSSFNSCLRSSEGGDRTIQDPKYWLKSIAAFTCRKARINWALPIA